MKSSPCARGPEKLSPQEYSDYRLWDPDLPIEEERRFVGKQAQHPMHFACNDRAWYAVVNDKLLFQQAMAGAGVPVPTLRAVIATRFGEQLWSLRLPVILTSNGPRISRAVAEIATGDNVADNFWRAGNLLGTVNPGTGRICRTISGSGEALTIDPSHPDTGGPITETALPDWPALFDLAKRAAWTLPGVRTQAWDIAVTDRGPILLEVNFGGDLTLAQLAWGRRVLDPEFQAHLLQCGYRL